MRDLSAKKAGSKIYTGAVYAFLYLPIVVLIIFSFNTSKLNAVWEGFTFKWYGNLFKDETVLSALWNSLFIALISTGASTIIGTLTATGMYKYKFKGKAVLDGVLYVPIVIPEIVFGIALLAFFSRIQIPLGLTTLIIAHITFSISYVVVVVKARLESFDKALEEAAMDLGASEFQTFLKVTLPVIAPGIIAGALLAFTLSIDDVIISFFAAGPDSTTLPLKIFSMVRFGVTPEINALSTLMLLITLSVAILSEKIKQNKNYS